MPQPLIALDASGAIVEVNTAAEHFFEMGRAALTRSTLHDLLPFGSPVFALVADALASQSTVNGYRLDISTPRTGQGAPGRRFRRAAAEPRRRDAFCCRNGQLPKKWTDNSPIAAPPAR